MTDRQALLAAIIANPDEDTPRLMFADWLDEQGDGYFSDWAALIRTQVEAAGTERFSRRWLELARLQIELFARRSREWDTGWGSRLGAVAFRRGFQEAAGSRAEQFAGRVELLFARNPIRALRLTDLVDDRGRFVNRKLHQSPHLERIHTLDLSETPILQAARFIRECGERLRNLRSLGVGRADAGWALPPGYPNAGQTDLDELLASPALAGLAALDLHDNPQLGEGEIPPLWPLHERLTWLDLSECAVGETGVTAIGLSPPLPNLRVLRLAEAAGVDRPRIGVNGVTNLWMMDAPKLEHLDLSVHQLGDNGAAAITDSPFLAGLRELKLMSNGIGNAGVRAIANSPRAANLRYLDLSENPITDAGATALVESPHLGQLGMLELCECEGITDRVRRALTDRFPLVLFDWWDPIRQQVPGLFDPCP